MFTEENKTLQREVKIRDQSLQEAGVKVETLEKRLEGSRKMADVIVELENDVQKAKRQEKVYEDAIEQVQRELEEVERELAGYKKEGGRGGEYFSLELMASRLGRCSWRGVAASEASDDCVAARSFLASRHLPQPRSFGCGQGCEGRSDELRMSN